MLSRASIVTDQDGSHLRPRLCPMELVVVRGGAQT